MQETEILRWMKILPAVTAFISAVLIVRIGGRNSGKKVLRACEELRGYLVGKSRQTSWYSAKEAWLCKKGADIHFGAWVEPLTWLALCLFSGIAGFIVGLRISWWCSVPMGIGFGFLPELLARWMNYRDNEEMLPEIKLIYHALEIQIRAGVYVTDALTECYNGMRGKRLRHALLDLAGDITMKSDIYDALARFQGKFDNRYIDALCITILQALESGQAVELLGDIAEQVKDMEVSVMGRKKGALDRSVTFYQLGVLAAVLGIVLYACLTQMFAAALRF